MKGTENLCFLLRYTGKKGSMMEVLYRLPKGEEMEAKDKEDGHAEDMDHVVEVFADADWASGKEARYSTSASIICADGIPIMSYTRTQKSTALSSCESEVLAASGAASEGVLLKRLFSFLTKKEVRMEVRTDSSSGKQWCLRNGVGGLKHIDLRILWLQRAVRKHLFKVKSVPTKLNIADLNTKKLSVQRRKFLLFLIGAMTKERGQEVPVGAEEMADHMSSVALSHQISRLKQVGKTTKNGRLLFTTCLIQMVMGTKGQPREFVRETYVYIEAVNMWMFAIMILILMVLFLQLVNLQGWKFRRQRAVVAEPEQEPEGDEDEGQVGDGGGIEPEEVPPEEPEEVQPEEPEEVQPEEPEEVQPEEPEEVQPVEPQRAQPELGEQPRRGYDQNEPERDPDQVPPEVQERVFQWMHENIRVPAEQRQRERQLQAGPVPQASRSEAPGKVLLRTSFWKEVPPTRVFKFGSGYKSS